MAHYGMSLIFQVSAPLHSLNMTHPAKSKHHLSYVLSFFGKIFTSEKDVNDFQTL